MAVLEARGAGAAAADHHRAAAQLGPAQQLDRGVEGVHVEVRDQAGGRGRGRQRLRFAGIVRFPGRVAIRIVHGPIVADLECIA